MPDRTMPPTATDRTAGRWDLPRQVVVLLSAIVAFVGMLAGVGLFGGERIGDGGGGGRLSTDESLVAPAGAAFSIWTPIYLGLLALAVWQFLPAQRADCRQRRAGWWLAASMVANAAWIFAAQADQLALTVLLIAIILVSLAVAYAQLLRDRPGSAVEQVVVDGVTGLYLGWTTVATIANIAAWLIDLGAADLAPSADFWAVVMLLAAGAIASTATWRGGRRLGYPLAATWGLSWIVVARTTGPTESAWAATAAGTAAAAVALTALAAWLRPRVPSRLTA